jgi:hypothetical protein
MRVNVRIKWLWWGAMVLIALVRFWLAGGQHLVIIGGSPHDDLLFLRLANNIAQGKWLGTFDNLILAKGPMYPLWIAACYRLGIPLFTARHLLYIASCGFAVWAVSPWIRSCWYQWLVFAVLLFNPAGFLVPSVMRIGLYLPLMNFVIASMFGLLLRCECSTKYYVVWTVFLGLFFGLQWLTRGEGIWLLPALLGTLTMAGFRIFRSAGWSLRILWAAVPLLVFWGCLLLIAAINAHTYGIWSIGELQDTPFKTAYGALTRVKPDTFHPYLPVSRQVRKSIYAVSPAFRELEPFLEGRLGRRWASYGESLSGFSADSGEIPGALFLWAFRDAVTAAGYYREAPRTMGYYQRLTDEINQACADGQLRCGPPRASLSTPWNPGFIPYVKDSMLEGLGKTCSFYALPRDHYCRGKDGAVSLFSTMTHAQPVYAPADPRFDGQTLDKRVLYGVRRQVLSALFAIYRRLLPWMFIAACVAWMAALYLKRRPDMFFLFNGLLLFSAVFRFIILSFINSSSFAGFAPRYSAPIYPVLLFFMLLCFYRLWNFVHASRLDF